MSDITNGITTKPAVSHRNKRRIFVLVPLHGMKVS